MIFAMFLASLETLLLHSNTPPVFENAILGTTTGLMVFLIAFYAGKVATFVFPEKKTSDLSTMKARIQSILDSIRPEGKSVNITVFKSRSPRAMLVSEGKGHRIFISDTLILSFSEEALRGCIAHEIGHVLKRHPLETAIILATLAMTRSLLHIHWAVAILILLWFLAFMRQFEYAANREAVKIVGKKPLIQAYKEFEKFSPSSGPRKKKKTWYARFSCDWFSGSPSIVNTIKAIRK